MAKPLPVGTIVAFRNKSGSDHPVVLEIEEDETIETVENRIKDELSLMGGSVHLTDAENEFKKEDRFFDRFNDDSVEYTVSINCTVYQRSSMDYHPDGLEGRRYSR